MTDTPVPLTNSVDDTRMSQHAPFFGQDEGVLFDVLQELDRERNKRAELEARVRVLEHEVHMQRRKNSKSSKTSVRDFVFIKTERDGYKEILDALTQDRPAFSARGSNKTTNGNRHDENSHESLPIHIVRLLEVMPYDARAQQYVLSDEEVYEWQISSSDKNTWQKELRYFPTFFKTLPIIIPARGKIVSDELAKCNPYFGSTAKPPKKCVLTNLEGTTIFNIDNGYPLPDDGTIWSWVGPWKVEKNNDTDEQGWAYSNSMEIMADLSYRNEFRNPGKGTANISRRRRKWNRLRCLIDYPYASNMTREYLKLIAEKSRLDVNLQKISEQLVDTKMNLTTLEADKEKTDNDIRKMKRDLKDKMEISNSHRSDDSLESPGLTKSVTQLMSKLKSTNDEEITLSDSSTLEAGAIDDIANKNERNVDCTAPNTSTLTDKQQLFDSIRDKGTGFFEILKQRGEQFDKMK